MEKDITKMGGARTGFNKSGSIIDPSSIWEQQELQGYKLDSSCGLASIHACTLGGNSRPKLLSIQLSFASYLYMKFFSKGDRVTVQQEPLPFVAIPIFVAEIIKCADRNWCLRTTSEQQWKTSLFSVPVPKPSSQSRTQTPAEDVEMASPTDLPSSNRIFPEARRLHEAYFLFNVSRYLIAEVNLKIRNTFAQPHSPVANAKHFRCLGLFEMYHDKVGKYLFMTFEPVDNDLKMSIFTYLHAEYKTL
ncbi:hypothetical protein FEM48_Zijuj01G0270300 [Ziziphus jujuba var. spinosa]|uniref:DUF4220 domain-containing protein n=1 Tax=Ziziphus jujuba var. spinosa TaxID=714518 RepID=A0A978W557_ZIZJJ|nr:hypothetical protein FEM48_Zijuj01G0270300 [Ziziphus jujuba var. spinosa]